MDDRIEDSISPPLGDRSWLEDETADRDKTLEPPRVLVVDDDPAIHTAFRLALENAPIRLTSVRTAKAALTAFSLVSFHLAYVDLQMPGLSGMDLLDRMPEKASWLHLCLITGYPDSYIEEIKRASDAGYNFEVLLKPFDQAQIWNTTARATNAFEGNE